MRHIAWILAVGIASAQGSEPRAKAGEYEVHERLKGVEIGAEYMVSSFSGQGRTFLAPDHLVVEVALFPAKGETVSAAPGEFTLRVDGKLLRAAAPQAVVMAMQRQEWRQPRGVQAAAGVGNDTVILGAPTRQMPPYGGPQRRTPAPPRAPEPDYRGSVPAPEPVDPAGLVVATAFPEGAFKGPVSGFVYFPFTGKASKIRTVELVYRDASLKLK